MKKKLLALLLGLTLCLSLAACGGDSAADSGAADTGAAEEGGDSGETVTLTVAASPTPHAVILEQCVPCLLYTSIRPMNSQVVTVLEMSMAAAMPLAKPRNPRTPPNPMGRNHRQYLGMAVRGWVSTSIKGR